MYEFLEACQPIIFESKDQNYPYWGRGSSLIVSNNSDHCYCVTAKHVFRNQKATSEQLRIFPSEHSRVSLPFDEQVSITFDENHPEAFDDILMLRIWMKDFDNSGDAPLVSQDMAGGCYPATSLRAGSTLWIAGFPSQSRYVDYDAAKISTTRTLRKAAFVGPSTHSAHSYELLVEEMNDLTDFDGLSGGPVYYLQEFLVNNVRCLKVLLAGLMTNGTASSRKMHFIDSVVIKEMVDIAQTTS